MLCNYLLNLMEGIDINEYNFKNFFEDLNFVFKFKTKITVKRPDNLSQREISLTKNKIKKELISCLQEVKIPNYTCNFIKIKPAQLFAKFLYLLLHRLKSP